MKRTRFLAVILTAVMLLAVMPFSAISAAGKIWDGSVADSFASGSGTEDDPYIITNGAELALLGEIDTTDLYFELGSDIILNDTSSDNWYDDANGWFYIEFYGNFDGKGYTISGLCVNPTESTESYEDVALFGYAQNASIANINMKDAYIVGCEDVGGIVGEGMGCDIYNCTFRGIVKSLEYQYINQSGNEEIYGGGYAGGIIGYSWSQEEDDGSCIENCINYGDVYTDSYNAGGIAGYVPNNADISYCENYGNICGSSYIGGIVGETGGRYDENESNIIEYDYVYVLNCVNKGAVIGHTDAGYYVGGIVGCAYTSQILYCANHGDISGDNEIGGIVGYASHSNTIAYSVNYGEITGICYIGGIMGEQSGSTETLSNGTTEIMFTTITFCVNHGDIIGLYNEEEGIYSYSLGGIAGNAYYGNFYNCYNYGDISGDSDAGGIVGSFVGKGDILSCYNNASVSIIEDYAGGIAGTIDATEGDIYILSCTNKGYISGTFDIGGIVGYTTGNDENDINIFGTQNKGTVEGACCVGGLGGYLHRGTVFDCLSDGHIIIYKSSYEINCPCGGGLFGECDAVSFHNSVSAGTVELCQDASFGGLVNFAYSTPTAYDCYYLDTLSDIGLVMIDEQPLTSELEGVSALTAAEMKAQATFAEFNFDTMWVMGSENPELMDAELSILGDINFDTVVDKKDYAMLKRSCFDSIVLEDEALISADVNGDGNIDKKDYTVIKRACFGMAEIK